MDHQARSLHYFHSYAVRDRINLSQFSDEVKVPDPKCIQLDNILPTKEDEEELRKNFTILMARTLCDYMPFFQKFGKGALERHISHKFSVEMSKKSEIVSCNLIL